SADRRPAAQPAPQATAPRQPIGKPAAQQPAAPQQPATGGDRWWGLDEGRQPVADQRADHFGQSAPEGGDEFPRFVRKGLRG
ncbi:MAG: hypothetical protein ABL908_22035, partial [Hyphomicrobium sp.]